MLTHMLFQGMFFIITPALICGAFAERMKFSTMVVFMILWGTLVYCPLVPLGVGRRHSGLWHGARQAISCGGGARLRRRHGRAHQLGRLGPDLCACCSASALGYGTRADAAAQPDLHRARRRPAVGRLVRLQRRQRAWRPTASRPAPLPPRTSPPPPARWPGPAWNGSRAASRRVLGACSGAVAGLVCITPAAGYVKPMPALVMGAAAGVMCCYLACTVPQAEVRLRRFARRLRRARRRRHAGRHPDRRVRHAGRLGHRHNGRAAGPARRRHAADRPARRHRRSPGSSPPW